MGKRSIPRFWGLMTLACVPFLAVACQSTAITEPCDILVNVTTLPATNSYLVKNDRTAAQDIAKVRGRYARYNCASKE